MNEETKAFWPRIRNRKRKWCFSAKIEDFVIWYNDIEERYNLGRYIKYGHIEACQVD